MLTRLRHFRRKTGVVLVAVWLALWLAAVAAPCPAPSAFAGDDLTAGGAVQAGIDEATVASAHACPPELCDTLETDNSAPLKTAAPAGPLELPTPVLLFWLLSLVPLLVLARVLPPRSFLPARLAPALRFRVLLI